MVRWKWILIAAGASMTIYGCSAKTAPPPAQTEAAQTQADSAVEAGAANGTGAADGTDASETGSMANMADPAKIAAAAKELIALRNPVIGDPSADGKLVDAVKQGFCVTESSTMELMTEKEPYELILHFDAEPNQADMKKAASVLLSLIDNCGIVSWDYPMVQGDGIATLSMDGKAASNFAGAADIKSYAGSEDKLGELLTLLSKIPAESVTENQEPMTEAEQPALKAQEPEYRGGG